MFLSGFFVHFAGCYKITTVFSHAQTVVLCVGCSTVLCQPTGGKARLTEGRETTKSSVSGKSPSCYSQLFENHRNNHFKCSKVFIFQFCLIESPALVYLTRHRLFLKSWSAVCSQQSRFCSRMCFTVFFKVYSVMSRVDHKFDTLVAICIIMAIKVLFGVFF